MTTTPNLGLTLNDETHEEAHIGGLLNQNLKVLDAAIGGPGLGGLIGGQISSQTDSSAPNGSIYLASNRSNTLTFKDLSGVTHTLTFTTP